MATCNRCENTGYLPDEEVFGLRVCECPDCNIAQQKHEAYLTERAELRRRIEEDGRITWDEFLESEYEQAETLRMAQRD